MNSVVFFNKSYKTPNEIPLYPNCVLFHGDSVDARSKSSTELENPEIKNRILVNYDFDKMEIIVDGVHRNADDADELFNSIIAEKNVVLDATTLGFTELFFAIKSLIKASINEFIILYVEPLDYTREKKGSDLFAISERNAGYKPIPTAIVDLADSDVTSGLFFLGYESDRIENAIEAYQMLSYKHNTLVIGIPAFQAGWELNSIVPHLEIIKTLNAEIEYCCANDPESAYDIILKTKETLAKNQKMFIAPIGTKPCGIASAIFASLYPETTGLLYDHRIKKNNRTDGTSIWHRYSICVTY